MPPFPGSSEPSVSGGARTVGPRMRLVNSFNALSPYRSLGSTWVFSLNSFHEISPSASGEDETAALYSARNVWPSRRGTSRVPPTSWALKPGAKGAIQRPPDLCTVDGHFFQPLRITAAQLGIHRGPVVRVAVEITRHPLVSLRAFLRGKHQCRSAQGARHPLDIGR